MIGWIIVCLYVGELGDFIWISNCYDYVLNLFGYIVFDFLKEVGKDVIVVGKINDIFNG